MEEAAVTAATGTMGPVIAKLAALLGSEYKLRWRTRKDVNFIRAKFKSMHSLLWTIWEREDHDAESKDVKKEALDLADDMDDAIDDFILGMERSSRGGNRRLIQMKITARAFQDMKNRVDRVSRRCRCKWKKKTARPISFFFARKISSPSKPSPRSPFVRKDASQVVGMDRPRDELIAFLVGRPGSTPVQPQLKRASIVGPAGMGKTTLAHMVYEAIGDKFQSRAFVSLTPNPDMKMVLTSILQQVAADSTVQFPAAKGASTEEEHLVNTISNFLKDKRYLVIIDDLWQYGEWEVIKKSLPENKLGSRIITSTRMNDIAEKCHDDFDTLLYKMNPRREYRSKGWVYQIGSENVGARIIAAMSSDIVGEGFDRDHPVVRMCGGMPLAILCMLSAVAKERDKQAQQGVYAKTRDVQDTIVKQVIQNGIQNTPGFEPLVESLQLGYDDLPHHMLKTCLLYCTIYPENHEMKRDYLVRRWIAHGFVRGENAAKGYFDELVNRGLIQFLDGFHARLFRYGMHPMIRNFLGRKFREDSFITCSSEITASSYSCQIRRLSIDYWPSSDGAVLGIDWSRIRSLVVFGGAHRVPLEQLERLRVLDLECDEALENHHLKDICGLLRVRHLIGLQGMGISEIPPEIVRLQHLETLDVRKTGITELPREIGDLHQLRSLDVSNTQGLVELPREVGDLQHLENLCLSKTNITELPREVVGRLKKLKTLDVSENGKIRELSREIIEALPHLEILDVSHTCITEIPSEVGSFQNLERLHLQSTKVTKIPREIGRLKKLKILELDERITTLPWEAGQLSQVEGLPECVRQVWKKTDLMSSLAREILSFQKQPGSSGDGGLIVGTKHMHIPGWIKEQFNNIGYLDIRICKLEEGCLVTLREMPSLQILKLRFEVVPKKRVVFSGEGFAKLVVLHIDSRVPQVTFQEGAMPWLQFLKFEIQFYSGSPNTDPMGIKHLVSLREVSFICNDWYQVDSPFISVTIDAVRKELQEHPRNSTTCYRGRAYVHVNGLQLRPLSD